MRGDARYVSRRIPPVEQKKEEQRPPLLFFSSLCGSASLRETVVFSDSV